MYTFFLMAVLGMRLSGWGGEFEGIVAVKIADEYWRSEPGRSAAGCTLQMLSLVFPATKLYRVMIHDRCRMSS